MIIVLSPAKTLDYETPMNGIDYTVANHLSKSAELIRTLKSYETEDISKLMGLSSNLAFLNFERYQSWKKPTKPSADARQAVFAFQGDVYQGLEAATMKKGDLKFAQKHLRILSGLYGVLKPLDLMAPYRLEMGTKLATKKHDDLYGFWKDTLTADINAQLAEQKDSTLINLASNEYFNALNKKDIAGDIVSPVFKDYKNGDYKIISFFAKKARGMMARYIIDNKVTNPDGLATFNYGGYKFNAKLSQDNAPTFTRKTS